MYFIEVSVASNFAGRSFYTYEHDTKLTKGTIVQVPYGRKKIFGVVRGIVKKPTFATKKITQVTELSISKESYALLEWMEQFYPYDYGEITNIFVPPNVLTKSRAATKIKSTPFTAPSLPTLTNDQQTAFKIISNNPHTLLHGDTGTGKTRVFLDYANSVLATGKSVLILTPEIGLTPQLEQTIQEMCGYPVYVIHSLKTPAHRKKIWQIAAENLEPALYIGPRSSLFLPYKNLGLVVADEAHDNSYKSMQNPRYNGLYVAAQLARIHKAHFVQSTATPNVTDYAIAQAKQIPIARMTKIAAGSDTSDSRKAVGTIIDLSDKKLFTKHKLIGDELLAATEEALQKNKQTMLFLNRRGSARIVQCNNCGHIAACGICGLPMTYHHDTHALSCHICGTQQKASNQCSECGAADLLFFAPGTKGLEQELVQLFPKARIARFDLDVAAKDSIHRRLKELKDGEFDIIIGTQLISKGFDLPKLSVVGVLNADNGFALPDYRAEEIAFQQLYQVTGRVGRGHTLSKFFIQTRQPSHPVIQAALARNWQDFYTYELHKRTQFKYPPLTHLAIATITKAKANTAETSATKLATFLHQNHPRITLLGPSPSYYETSRGGSSWQLLLKASSRSQLLAALISVPSEWTIDIDPTSVL